jgi:hypothetical protein
MNSHEKLKGAADVQDGLDPSGDHSNGSPPQLGEVGTDIQTCE